MPDTPSPAAEQGRLAKLAAAPLTLILGEERYELAPLNLRQWAQLKRFAQERAIEEFGRLERAMIKVGASAEALERFRARSLIAFEHPLETWPSDDHEVRIERVLLSLKPGHPDITREKVEQLLDAEVNRQRITQDLDELAGLEARLKNSRRARGENPPAAPRATRKASGSTSSRPSARPTAGRPARSAT